MSIDLTNIKTQIKTILDTANTTTASRDLSLGMGSRVQKVFKINPAKIPIQASLFPCVTMFIQSKGISADTIAKNQATGKRKSQISIKIVGATWNSNFADITQDPSDNDIEDLMENIEEILRNNGNLNNAVNWAIPTGVDYYTTVIDEQVHIRSAELTLDSVVYY